MEESNLIKKKIYLDDVDTTILESYRLNFKEARSCGAFQVYSGKEITEESFEVYSELLECGLEEKQIKERLAKLVEDIRKGRIDVTL